MTLDGVGPWPPIQESHVEMDGAFALYEAWVKLQLGEVDCALVYGYGKSSPGPIHEVLSRQLDPYSVAPLWPDAISLAALQARAGLEAGTFDEAAMAEVATRSRTATPSATRRPSSRGSGRVEEYLAEEPIVDPLRRIGLPADHRRRRRRRHRRRRLRPGALRAPGVDPGDRPPHRPDGARPARPHRVGERPARRRARPASAPAGFDTAELHAPFTHQELLLRDGARASTARSTSTRRAAPSAPTRSWRPASSASARRPSGSSTARPAGPSPTRRADPASSRTSWPCWKGGG